MSFYLKRSWRTRVIEPLNGRTLLLSSHTFLSFQETKEFVKAPNEKDLTIIIKIPSPTFFDFFLLYEVGGLTFFYYARVATARLQVYTF